MIELLFPSECAGCGQPHQGLLCPACTPLGLHNVGLDLDGIERIYTVCGYDQGMGKALRYAKYGPHRMLMLTLANLFAERMARTQLRGHVDWLVPMPSTLGRRVRRGFSPSVVLARRLQARTGVPVRFALQRRPGPRQAGLDRRERQRNLQGSLRSRQGAPGRVLLVDDVVTTGVSAETCARELLGDETEAVWLATLCAVRPRVSLDRETRSESMTLSDELIGDLGRTV